MNSLLAMIMILQFITVLAWIKTTWKVILIPTPNHWWWFLPFLLISPTFFSKTGYRYWYSTTLPPWIDEASKKKGQNLSTTLSSNTMIIIKKQIKTREWLSYITDFFCWFIGNYWDPSTSGGVILRIKR